MKITPIWVTAIFMLWLCIWFIIWIIPDSSEIQQAELQAKCENLYFQPNATELMELYNCDIEAVESEIKRVQEWKY